MNYCMECFFVDSSSSFLFIVVLIVKIVVELAFIIAETNLITPYQKTQIHAREISNVYK